MSSRKIYIQELNKILNPIAFYVWKPVNTNDVEEEVDYIHYRILFDELTKEQTELIFSAGNLKFVYSIDIIVDAGRKKYLFIKTADLKKLWMLKDIYLDKQLEINIHLNYINDKINKYM